MLKKSAAVVAMTAGLILPGVAFAAAPAFTTTDLNIRTGPGTSYQRFGTIPDGGRVTVHGCLTGYNWCDVSWAGERGWVSGNYLAYAGQAYARRAIPSIGVTIGLPIIDFSPTVYHRRYYVSRPWYRDRFLDRREVRQDRRELRRARRDVREERRDLRQSRRELRQERRAGGNTRDELRQVRQERRQLRDARRELRRERRD
jgi:uncharacterized protein YraI